MQRPGRAGRRPVCAPRWRVAVVTGSGSGIGRAVSVELAAAGAHVLATSRTETSARETARLCGERCEAIRLDVTDAGERRGLADRLGADSRPARHPRRERRCRPEPRARRVGAHRRGVGHGARDQPLERLSPGADSAAPDAARRLDCHDRIRGVARRARRRRRVCRFERRPAPADPCAGGPTLPSRIRANCVCPGNISTPLTDTFLAAAEDPGRLRAAYAADAPMNRLGTPAEVAACVRFLASAEASFVTGAALAVDGGMTAI